MILIYMIYANQGDGIMINQRNRKGIASSPASAPRPTNRQWHGQAFEDFALENIAGLSSCDGYTSRYDGFFTSARQHIVVASIKNSQIGGEVDLASCQRILTAYEPALLIVGWHERKEPSPRIVDVSFLPDGLRSLCGNADVAKRLLRLVDGFMAQERSVGDELLFSHEYDRTFRKHTMEMQREWDDISGKGCRLVPRVKRDHKKQFRMQCAIPGASYDMLIGSGIRTKGIDMYTATNMMINEWGSHLSKLISQIVDSSETYAGTAR